MSQSRKRYTPFTFDNSWIVEYTKPPVDVIRTRQRITDEAGDVLAVARVMRMLRGNQ